MIKLPYYNENDVDLLPFNSKLSQNEMTVPNGCNFIFEVKNKVYFRMNYNSSKGYHAMTVACGDFSGSLDFGYHKVDGTWKNDVKAPTGESSGIATYEIYFEQTSEGLLVSVNCPSVVFSKVYPDLKIGNLTVKFTDVFSGSTISNIVASESKNDMYFASTQDIAVDSIDNWEINSANEYVLTNIDKTGIVHISQEKLDKLLADNDIISCAIVMTTEKRGAKLKNMEFAVGDTKNTVEIPPGKGKVLIPLDFKNGTDMKNISLTVRG